jgi:hypothetical protein
VNPFVGRWRITAMDRWAPDALELRGPAFISFGSRGGMGCFRFVDVEGWTDCRFGERHGRPAVEFTWEGDEDGRRRCGRGWATLAGDDVLEGHLYFHQGHDSAFEARREAALREAGCRVKQRTAPARLRRAPSRRRSSSGRAS